MALPSIKKVLERAGLAAPQQFDEWAKAWRVAQETGTQETLLTFFSRERGISEEVFLQALAKELGWSYLDLPKLTVPPEVRAKISTKVAFQYNTLPVTFENDILTVAVDNPFNTALINAVEFDAKGPVKFALATRAEIEKALKKYYGVGAETLDEMSGDEPIDLLLEDKEITEGDQEASVIKFINQPGCSRRFVRSTNRMPARPCVASVP